MRTTNSFRNSAAATRFPAPINHKAKLRRGAVRGRLQVMQERHTPFRHSPQGEVASIQQLSLARDDGSRIDPAWPVCRQFTNSLVTSVSGRKGPENPQAHGHHCAPLSGVRIHRAVRFRSCRHGKRPAAEWRLQQDRRSCRTSAGAAPGSCHRPGRATCRRRKTHLTAAGLFSRQRPRQGNQAGTSRRFSEMWNFRLLLGFSDGNGLNLSL